MSEPRIEERDRSAGAAATPDTAGWKCVVHFMGCIPQPSEETMACYLPAELMAHLPDDGGLACVLVACRVEDVDPAGKVMQVGARIAAPTWHDDLENWVENTLLESLERAFIAAAEVVVAATDDRPAYTVEMPPTRGSELEVAAYFSKGMVETPEEFVKNLGVLVNMRFEYLAELRRVNEREAARAERLRIQQERRLAKEAEEAKKPWGRVRMEFKRFGAGFWNWLLPVAPAENVTAPVPPKDPWAAHSELFIGAFVSACGQSMGSLLRRVTTYSPLVSAHLAREGVMVGESPTMIERMRQVMQVTRMDTVSRAGASSAVFDIARADGLEDEAALPEARIEPPLGRHEVRFTPRGPQRK